MDGNTAQLVEHMEGTLAALDVLALPPNHNANGHQPTPKKGFCVARGLRITKENVYVPSGSK